jgi:short-subunit dehydrogenase
MGVVRRSEHPLAEQVVVVTGASSGVGRAIALQGDGGELPRIRARHARRAAAHEGPGYGGIIQIGSALVYRSIPLQSAYCASKAAIRGFTDSVRSELLHDRIPVTLSILELPAVDTPQFDVVRSRLPNHPRPVAPIYQPEVIARGACTSRRTPSASCGSRPRP